MKSYSKIRHIKEANQKIEDNFLSEQKIFNNLKAGVAGVGANLKTAATNVFDSSQDVDKSRQLEGFLKKVKVRSEYLDKQLDYLTQELGQLQEKMNELAKTKPNYADEVKTVTPIITNYISNITNLKKIGENLRNTSITYTAGGGEVANK
jgi:chromosome segregation ATPase